MWGHITYCHVLHWVASAMCGQETFENYSNISKSKQLNTQLYALKTNIFLKSTQEDGNFPLLEDCCKASMDHTLSSWCFSTSVTTISGVCGRKHPSYRGLTYSEIPFFLVTVSKWLTIYLYFTTEGDRLHIRLQGRFACLREERPCFDVT